MARLIPNQDYVEHFDAALDRHRRWLLAALDELTVHDPEILSKGRLRDLWIDEPKAPVAVPPASLIGKRAAAWLAVVRYAEGTAGVDGYRTTFAYLRKIDTNKPHPGIVNTANGYSSDASGAYQFLSMTWKDIHGGKNPAMTPANQDQAAIALMRRRGLDPDVAKFTKSNVAKLAPEWASLPTLAGKSFYGQPVKSFASLENIFAATLGVAAPPPPQPVPAPTGPVGAGPRQSSTLSWVTEAEKGLVGPKIPAPLADGDHYLLVNGKANAARAYDSAGRFLWVIPALCHGQVEDWKMSRGDTPPGLYRVGQLHADYEQDSSETFSRVRRSYGWYSLDLVEMENQEAGFGRAGIMIHGGGTGAGWPGAWKPKQPLYATLGCVRMRNMDLRDKVMPLARKGKLFVGVYQPG